ncbi:hypothetical protein GWI33_006745 [Rhynchophorus ferrugineus]|uniref:CLIP domain-containing serine protease n=1 Tax=Rhynchophorus ferrugineus TaxID=354439 RepID=A0A834IFC6_RHYFE|nr:hypothetical protein GWI33_006745 [Rhynchophorus ferrugineus]
MAFSPNSICLVVLAFTVFLVVDGGIISRYLVSYEDTICTPPLGDICIEIRQCPFFSELLDRSPKPRPRSIVKIIRDHQCGFENNKPKVCCITSTTTSTTTSTVQLHTDPPREHRTSNLPDMFQTIKRHLTLHKNYPLLPTTACGPISSNSRITSGKKTSLEEFPWMALIAYNTPDVGIEFRCGGTIISDRYVLTAAHCVHNSSTIIGVRLGEYDINNNKQDCDGNYCSPPVQDFYIDETVIHKNYDPKTFDNDIALLRLSVAANFSYANVQPICLPVEEINDDLSGKFAVISGWGVTEEGHKSPVLLKASVPVIPIETCKNLYKRFTNLTDRQICAGGYKGQDSCKGDSGGPMMYVGLIQGTPRFIQYGIVSFGPSECGTDGQPGIYTRVGSYLTWILDHIRPD